MYTQVNATYAGFWRRGGALVIDWLLSGLICLPLSALFWALSLYGIGDNPVFFSYTGADLAHAAARAAYFFFFTVGMGATPGKRLLHMRVVSASGGPLGWWDALYRETVGRFLNGLLFLGYLFAAGDQQKRTFADRLCDSRVILLPRMPAPFFVPPVPAPAPDRTPPAQGFAPPSPTSAPFTPQQPKEPEFQQRDQNF